MTNDVLRLANAGQLVILLIASIAALGFIAASLLATHTPLGVVVLLGAPGAVWLMGMLSGRLSRDTREYQSLLAGTIRQAANLLARYRVIKGIRAEADPKSALDLRDQLDVMTIVQALAREGRIVVIVLHDLTLAASRADHLVVLDRGEVAAEGLSEAALSPSILSTVYGVEARVERCSRGRLHIIVDGPACSPEIRHAR